MLDRRSFMKLASAITVLAGAPAALAARVRRKTITGTVISVNSRRKVFKVSVGDYDDSETYTIKTDRKTRFYVKEGVNPVKKGSFRSVEEDADVQVVATVIKGKRLRARKVTVIIPDYDGGGY